MDKKPPVGQKHGSKSRDQLIRELAALEEKLNAGFGNMDLADARARLQESDKRFQDFASVASDWFWETDAELRYTYITVGEGSERVEGYSPVDIDNFIGKTRWEMAVDEDVESPKWRNHVADLKAHKPFRNFEYLRQEPNGKMYVVLSSGVPVFDDKGVFKGYRGSASDITVRRESELALKTSEKIFRDLVENSPSSIHLKSIDGIFRMANNQFLDHCGLTIDQVVGKTSEQLFSAEDSKLFLEQDQEVIRKKEVITRQQDVLLDDGTTRAISNTKFPILNDQGDVIEIGTISTDLSELIHIENEMLAKDALLRAIFDHLPVLISVRDREGRYKMVNRYLAEHHNLSEEEIVGRTMTEIFGPSEKTDVDNLIEQVVRTGEPFVEHDFVPPRRPDINALFYVVPIFDAKNDVREVVTMFVDITDLKNAEQQARALRAAVEEIPEAFIHLDSEDRIVYVNKACRELNDAIPEFIAPGTKYNDYLKAAVENGLMPAAIGREAEWLEERFAYRRDPKGAIEVERQDGQWLLVQEQRLSDGGTIIHSTNITSHKRSEEEIRRVQNLDAIGRLTGGVAHDFNNLLSVVTGNAEMALDQVDPSEVEITSMLEAVLRAAERGADLTQGLLAFSRKQRLRPKALDIDARLPGIVSILGRTIGAEIEIRTEGTDNLWSCIADAGQLENAMLNMAINARDALPDGGVLTIETANHTVTETEASDSPDVAAGDYVMLSVGDNGTGMSPDVISHIFEPFFTTKEVGKGTGLGLSMVFGFVQQSGGHVNVESSPGVGTTFNLFLPRAGANTASPSAPSP